MLRKESKDLQNKIQALKQQLVGNKYRDAISEPESTVHGDGSGALGVDDNHINNGENGEGFVPEYDGGGATQDKKLGLS